MGHTGKRDIRRWFDEQKSDPAQRPERLFRRVRRDQMFGLVNRKISRRKAGCEFCDFTRLADIPGYMDWEAHAEEDFPEGFYPHIFVKCPKCRKQIGIRLRYRQKVS